MERTDERFKWFETHVNHSFKPRNDELKRLVTNDDNKRAIHEFLNNEDIKRMYIFHRKDKTLAASIEAPPEIKGKAMFFLKHTIGKITKANIDSQISYFETTESVLDHIHLMLREVYLPVLCGAGMGPSASGSPVHQPWTSEVSPSSTVPSGVNVDKLMDVLHRLMSSVAVAHGHIQGTCPLALPSVEVLAEASMVPVRKNAVLHTLESTVINWTKQIKLVLHNDPIKEVYYRFGPEPTILDEMEYWHQHKRALASITDQLEGPVAQDILVNLQRANSQYYHAFSGILSEIEDEIEKTRVHLITLEPLTSWFEQVHCATSAEELVPLFPALLRLVFLLWENSRYYHKNSNLCHFLCLFSNDVVHRALSIIGDDVIRDPLKSHSKLKDVLRICAAFRGTYLDMRDKANEINSKNVTENAEKLRLMPKGQLWPAKVYGPYSYKARYGRGADIDPDLTVDDLLLDSPWPARNADCFDLLNAFMDRCNDCLELVQTTQHFRLLADTAEIGGAGSRSLDALVREIHVKYNRAMELFFERVDNVFDLTNTQVFERAFFDFRKVVKELEKALGSILRQSMHQCPTVLAKMRLLEVFEGINGRDVVHEILRDKDELIVRNFTDELQMVQDMFLSTSGNPPSLPNVPPLVCSFYWLYALRKRIQVPMDKIKVISPHLLSGDPGWRVKELYRDCIESITKLESKKLKDWQESITEDLTDCLKQPLLLDDTDYMNDGPLQVSVNLDPRLILLLKEIRYLIKDPFNVELPTIARKLLRTTDLFLLRVTATRLESITSKYNYAMNSMSKFEIPLLERQFTKIEQVLYQGKNTYTWRLDESADFIERATVLVCHDLAYTLNVVQTNASEITDITESWSSGVLDLFSARDTDTVTLNISDLCQLHKEVVDRVESTVVPGGNKIHQLLDGSLNVIQISQASPAWQDYVFFFNAVVMDGLKRSILVSLRSVLNHIFLCNSHEENEYIPILCIRLELLDTSVVFRPPLEESTNQQSVQEFVQSWISDYHNRCMLVPMLGSELSSAASPPDAVETYREFLDKDEEIMEIQNQIFDHVQISAEECRQVLGIFDDYSFLWLQDVDETFDNFLHGKISPNPFRTPSRSQYKHPNMFNSRTTSRASSCLSRLTVEEEEIAERSFLTPKSSTDGSMDVPSLDEFNAEIDIYKSSRDELEALPSHRDVGWLRVDLEPIKDVLITLSSKWMWTFTKYLADQVTTMLNTLAEFLSRMEPEIESITGEERDTGSFMRMMRLFNEVSSQVHEMEGKFSAMRRTVELLERYNQELPAWTLEMLQSGPASWNALRTKVSLAKQLLGPRVHQEETTISADLAEFHERIVSFKTELDKSEVFNPECSIEGALLFMDNFSKRLSFLENEAQDLVELQDLLETNIVDFNILTVCRQDVDNLKLIWESVRTLQAEQHEWKRHRWQKMNTRFLNEATERQQQHLESLPEDIKKWELYASLMASIISIRICLPLIDDLVNPAMRTRHWKQLVRVTGGAVQIDNETLKRMTLGEMLTLGLQDHVDDVRLIVQRAVKDLKIELSLKTYEEVWLSKMFELEYHARDVTVVRGYDAKDGTSSEAGFSDRPSVQASRAHTTSRVSSQSVYSRGGRAASLFSLPASMTGDEESLGEVVLLSRTDLVLQELEAHQTVLGEMAQNTAAGSFMDEVVKWQKQLQQVEMVLHLWIQVQNNWVELEEIFLTPEIGTSMMSEFHKFQLANRDFRLLMKATERNPNVLQCCGRKNINTILEKTNVHLERCRKALLNYLDKRRDRFPWFYFLAAEDILHIVGNSYNIDQLNKYIRTLWENVGALLHREVEAESHSSEIFGVESVLKEPIYFKKAVPCSGPVEAWLSEVMTSLQEAVRRQFALALDLEHPESQPKDQEEEEENTDLEEQSSSRLASAKQTASATPSKKKAGRNSLTVKSHPNQSHTSMVKRTKRESDNALQLGSRTVSDVMGVSDSSAGLPHTEQSDWILNHVTEVVYLAQNVRFTQSVEEVLTSDNPEEAIKTCRTDTTKLIKEHQQLLRNLEGQEEKLSVVISEAPDARTSDGGQMSVTLTNALGTSTQTVNQLSADRGGAGPGTTAANTTRSGTEVDTRVEGKGVEDAKEEDPIQSKTDIEDDTVQEPVLPTEIESREHKEEDQQARADLLALRRRLLPSQLHKVRTFLVLLLEQLSTIEGLEAALNSPKNTGGDSAMDLWESYVKYYLEKESVTITVKVKNMEREYGFHFIGSAERYPLTAKSCQAVEGMLSAISAMRGVNCASDKGALPYKLVLEAARHIGKPYYMVNCSRSTTNLVLANTFRGAAATGAWVCFTNINRLGTDQQSVLGQLSISFFEAQRCQSNTVTLLGEEVPLSQADTEPMTLNAAGAILTTLDRVKPGLRETSSSDDVPACSSGRRGCGGFLERPLVFSTLTCLPSRLVDNFRIISVPPQNLSLLASEGFQVISKVNQQLDSFSSAAAAIMGCVIDKSSWIAQEVLSPTQLLGIFRQAGIQLRESRSILSGSQDISLSEEQVFQLERDVIVKALQDFYLPRLTSDQTRIFSLLIRDCFPESKVDALGDDSHRSMDTVAKKTDKRSSEMIDFNLLTTLVPADSLVSLNTSNPAEMPDLDTLITGVAQKMGLEVHDTFHSNVTQLMGLYNMHRTVVLAGTAGSGKSTIIQALQEVEKLRLAKIVTHKIYPSSFSSEDFLGYYSQDARYLQSGMLQAVLRSFCNQGQESNSESEQKIQNLLILDGYCSPEQREAITALIHPTDALVLGSGEHLTLPAKFHVLWEVENLSELHPGLVPFVGIMCLSQRELDWQITLKQWLKTMRDTDASIAEEYMKEYLPPVIEFVTKFTRATQSKDVAKLSRLSPQSINNCVIMTITLLDGLLNATTTHDLGSSEYELLITYSILWGFGGNLDRASRIQLSEWWTSQFRPPMSYPTEGTLFDYFVDLDKLEYLPWLEMLPSFVGRQNAGISDSQLVVTPGFQALAYNLALLADMNRPVLLLGPTGCGKTTLVQDRIKSVCSGEVAEVLNVTVQANKFVTSKTISAYLDEKMEWKHGMTYIPRGNKRLMCFIDDLSLAFTDSLGQQTSVELVREIMDNGGHYFADTQQWRALKNVNFVATVNPGLSSAPINDQRFLRHFAILAVNYPDPDEQEAIFSLMLRGHFLPSHDHAPHTGGHVSEERRLQLEREANHGRLLDQLVRVTVNLQERLQRMFLSISQRCHYIFSMRTLSVIFRNLCYSLNSESSNANLLTLWRNECDWIYNERMVDRVDQDRYKRAYIIAVKKEFAEQYRLSDELLEILLNPKPPLCTNIVLQESGLVSVRQHNCTGDMDSKWGDGYQVTKCVQEARELIENAIDEYNKINPRILIPLYDTTVKEICRLARTLNTPHNLGHMCLLAEGNPGQVYMLVRLSAHLNGYRLILTTPTSPEVSNEDKLNQFKVDLVAAYTSSGVKSEKTLMVIRDYELISRDFLVYLTEFVVFGSVTHLFTFEEQTQIINSIRTEVTQAGLAYTREVAWDFFLSSVRRNFRIFLIISETKDKFQSWCRDYPSLLSTMTFVWFQHLGKPELVQRALFHLSGELEPGSMSAVEQENIAHLLATMHLSIRQQDGGEEGSGSYRHVNNTTYQKFVETFCSLIKRRYHEVNEEHQESERALNHIQQERSLAKRLHKQLQQEKMVLEDWQKGADRMLMQIGQETAITESQMRTVKQQLDKIRRLKKLLPEYQVSHERAVYKAISTVAETKKAVNKLNADNLSELRGLSKPPSEVEDLMSAVIMILKSPSADLTWHKGAKRQMANLERFIEELLCFDEQEMTDETLSQVEDFIKKPGFELDTMTEVAPELPACLALCRWVRGVVAYHRTMHSRVRPLHAKVDETAREVEVAEARMKSLEGKRKSFEVRLIDLARSFEEATIDKNNQNLKAEKMDKMLVTASQLRKIMASEREKFRQIFKSYKERLACVPGAVAIAAGLTTYLGPYHYGFRYGMLSYHWPKCLRERGIRLVVDSIDVVNGRTIDFSLLEYNRIIFDNIKLSDSESDISLSSVHSTSQREGSEALPEDKPVKGSVTSQVDEEDEEEQEEEEEEEGGEEDAQSLKGSAKRSSESGTQDNKEEIQNPDSQRTLTPGEEAGSNRSPRSMYEGDGGWIGDEEDRDSDIGSTHLDNREYTSYLQALTGLIVGKQRLTQWTIIDLSMHQLLNAAIIETSVNRPPFLMDPHGIGLVHLKWIVQKTKLARGTVEIDMHDRSNPQILVALEDAIMQGRPVHLKNCTAQLDNLIEPMIHHANMSGSDQESRMIRFGIRRILCNPSFKVFFSTEIETVPYTGDLTSLTNLINYGVSEESLVEDLMNRAFNKLKPELYKERRLALEAVQHWHAVMVQCSLDIRAQLTDSVDSRHMWSEATMSTIAEAVERLEKAHQEMLQAKKICKQVTELRDGMMPLARHGASVYSSLKALKALQPEYLISLPYFLELFDEAIGGVSVELPEGQQGSTEEFARKSTMIRSNSIDKTLEEDNEENFDTESIAPDVIAGEENDTKFVEIVLSAREADERHKVMQEITGRQAAARKSSVNDLDTFLLNRGTLRPRDVLRDSSATLVGSGAGSRGLGQNGSGRGGARVGLRGRSDLSKKTSTGGGAGGSGEVAQLPTEGVEYSALSDEEIKTLSKKITELVYHKIRFCLFEEDIVLFALVLFLYDSEFPPLSVEELNFFVKGVSPLDFNSTDEAPAWLPDDVWKQVLGLSTLRGPLYYICLHIIQNQNSWKEWYESVNPELTIPPILKTEDPENSPQDEGKDEDNPEVDRASTISIVHQLILIRLFRPERLQTAIHHHMGQHFAFTGQPEPFHLEELEPYMDKHFGGILVLIPRSAKNNPGHHLACFPQPNPVRLIFEVAERAAIRCETVACNSTCLTQLSTLLETTSHSNDWLIIEDVHLLDDASLSLLSQYLEPRAPQLPPATNEASPDEDPDESRGPQSSNQQPQKPIYWLTCEAGTGRLATRLSGGVLNRLAVVASTTLHEDLHQSAAEVEDRAQEDVARDNRETSYVRRAISSMYGLIPERVLEETLTDPNKKRLYSAFCLTCGLYLLRQSFGSRGISVWKVFTEETLHVALMDVLAVCEDTTKVVDSLWKTVLSCIFVNDIDVKYARVLLERIVGAAALGDKDVQLGDVVLTLPPSDMRFGEINKWLIDQPWADDSHLASLTYLESEVITTFHQRRSDLLVSSLDDMMNHSVGNIIGPVAPNQNGTASSSIDSATTAAAGEMSMLKLRTVLDYCQDRLPPLIEPHDLGDELAKVSEYHNPSTLSLDAYDSVLEKEVTIAPSKIIPETLSHVLREECSIYNRELCSVRQDLCHLGHFVLTGAQSIPGPWLRAAAALEQESLPDDWTHGDSRTTVHNLTSWVQYQCDRYSQLRRWLTLSVTADSAHGHTKVAPGSASSSSGHNMPHSVWLGGFHRPQAFLAALRHEKAMSEGCAVADVMFTIELTTSFALSPFACTDNSTFFITGAHISGGVHTTEKKLDISKNKSLTAMPTFQLKVMTNSELDHPESYFACPVVKNAVRHTVIDYFNVPFSCEKEDLVLYGTCIVLDSGCVESHPLRPRIPIVTQTGLASSGLLTLPSARSGRTSEEPSEYRLATLREEEEGATIVDSTERSDKTLSSDQPSQISDREYPANAPTLPPDLQLSKEQPLRGGSQTSDKAPSDGGESQRSQLSLRSQKSLRSQGAVSNQSGRSFRDSRASTQRSQQQTGTPRSEKSIAASVHSDRSSTLAVNAAPGPSKFSEPDNVSGSNDQNVEQSSVRSAHDGDNTSRRSVEENETVLSEEESETSTPRTGDSSHRSQQERPRYEPEHSTIYEEKTQASISRGSQRKTSEPVQTQDIAEESSDELSFTDRQVELEERKSEKESESIKRDGPQSERDSERIKREDAQSERDSERIKREHPQSERGSERIKREDPQSERDSERIKREDPQSESEEEKSQLNFSQRSQKSVDDDAKLSPIGSKSSLSSKTSSQSKKEAIVESPRSENRSLTQRTAADESPRKAPSDTGSRHSGVRSGSQVQSKHESEHNSPGHESTTSEHSVASLRSQAREKTPEKEKSLSQASVAK